MIDRVAGNKTLPNSFRQDIIERTDGIPLFVEEMTKAVLETESEGAAQQAAAAVPATALAVPASLHASLMARLDRLGSAKQVAQIGSAIGREFSHALLGAVANMSEAELASALDRLVAAGLFFRQGVRPHATYLFKHALVQDAAYTTILREPRRALHARIAETLEREVVSEAQPELLARHYTGARQIEKAVRFWAQAGQLSLARSALVEAKEQLTRALSQITTLPLTPALRQEQIRLQVALLNPLYHVNGPAALETKVAAEQAQLLIEKAEALGEPPEDQLLLFSVLFGFWGANFTAFNGDVCRDLAAQYLELAIKHGTSGPLLIAHRMMGVSLMMTGAFVESRAHYDQALLLYNPAEHRPLAAKFGQDTRAAVLSYRSIALWLLGYPSAALADADQALVDAREIGQAATLMLTLTFMQMTHAFCGSYSRATALADELVAIAGEKSSSFWKAAGMLRQGWVRLLIARASDTASILASANATYRSTGATLLTPLYLSLLAAASMEVGLQHDAWRYTHEAIATIEATKEFLFEAEVNRMAGEMALRSTERDTSKAQRYFDRALTVARQQEAKSWELRAAMSLARLWRDQGKVQQARELLAPVYGWFTEGFDTLDLKEAKALLEELAA